MSKRVLLPKKVQETVILLHGLARTHRSMRKLEFALTQSGYAVLNLHYPSTRYPIEKLVAKTLTASITNLPHETTIHFVTHSMGGILVRHYLNQHTQANLGRVVMLGPPNKGSQVVDKLKNLPGFHLVNGPAGLQLGSHPSSLPNCLGPAKFEVGVIAGSRTINPILSMLLPSPNDGKVTVENTKLEGMLDHITLPVAHPFLMRNPVVINQVLHFLKFGTFDH